MGGVMTTELTLPHSEHNIAADPVAFSRICSFHIPVFLVPLNLTLKHALPNRAMEEISRCALPLAVKISLWARLWRVFTLSFGNNDHWFKDRILLHDPITCMAATRKSAFRWKHMPISASKEGVLHAGKGNTVSIAIAVKNKDIASLISQVVSSVVTHKNMV
jgi:inosine-uridine nucleoside N-ribohydrolase